MRQSPHRPSVTTGEGKTRRPGHSTRQGELAESTTRFLTLPLNDQLLNGTNGFGRIKTLGTRIGTVHNGVAPIQLEWILQFVQSLASCLITRVCDPAICGQQDSWAQVAVSVPPVAGAGSGAAEAQDALPHPVQLGPLLFALQAFS